MGRLSIVIPGIRCRFLRDSPGGATTCEVYERRFEAAPWCLTLPAARESHALAADCPSHTLGEDVAGKHRVRPGALASARPAIARALLEAGVPAWVDVEGVLAFLTSAGLQVSRTIVIREGILGFVVEPGGLLSRNRD